MRIAVAGWYFHDEFLRSLWKVKDRYPVMIVAHRDNPALRECDLPYVITENVGLEWGAYDHYLRFLWPEDDSVLFTHDDIRLRPLINQDYELIPPERVLEKIAAISYDHAYIFQDRAEDVINCGMHGRMVYFSDRLLRIIKNRRGFPYDSKNFGFTGEGEKPKDIQGANAGIYYVNEMLKFYQEKRPDWTLLKRVYFSSIQMGYRGRYDREKDRYISEHLSEPIMGYENKNICLKCGGACCKRMPAPALPNDFGNGAGIEGSLSKALRSGKWAIDWLELETLKEPENEDKGEKAYFIRPAVKGKKELLDTSVRGECIFLKDNGCELPFDKRPNGCRNMEPREDGDCIQHGTTVRGAALSWMPFIGLIEKIAEEILSENADT